MRGRCQRDRQSNSTDLALPKKCQAGKLARAYTVGSIGPVRCRGCVATNSHGPDKRRNKASRAKEGCMSRKGFALFVALPLLTLLAYVAARGLLPESSQKFIYAENGPIELGTAISFA